MKPLYCLKVSSGIARKGVPSAPVQISGSKPACDVKGNRLAYYLCDVARDPDGTTYPRACKRCESPCAYGKRYLAITEARKENQHGKGQ